MTTSTAEARLCWVVTNLLAGRMVSALSVPDPAAAVALATVVRRFWPDLEPRVTAGPDAAAGFTAGSLGLQPGGARDGR